MSLGGVHSLVEAKLGNQGRRCKELLFKIMSYSNYVCRIDTNLNFALRWSSHRCSLRTQRKSNGQVTILF